MKNVVALVGAVLLLLVVSLGMAEQASEPLVQKGQHYILIWGFFTEVVVVDKVLADGWVLARTLDPQTGRPDKRAFTTNLNQVLAFIKTVPPSQRAAN